MPSTGGDGYLRPAREGAKKATESPMTISSTGDSDNSSGSPAVSGSTDQPPGASAEVERKVLWSRCEKLAQSPCILDCFADELARQGVVGEERAAKLLYLILNTRFLPRPVSASVKGPSSSGKSYLVERVLAFFPQSARYEWTAMSERALAYGDEPLAHKFLVIYEAAGLQGDMANYLVRSLQSEGRIRYQTVEKTKAGLRPRAIVREGPTGLLLTTTAIKLHPENETRLLSIATNDSRSQTKAIMKSLARGGRDFGIDPAWAALQEWLDGAEHRVEIPYAEPLADAIPPVAVRLRRDFTALIALIGAHAILHQATRERDREGRVVATLDDYKLVRELVHDLMAEGVEASVPPNVRETVATVSKLGGDKGKEVTVKQVADELGIGESSRRKNPAFSKIVRRAKNIGRDWFLESRFPKSARFSRRLTTRA
jgi:hypothetical protein